MRRSAGERRTLRTHGGKLSAGGPKTGTTDNREAAGNERLARIGVLGAFPAGFSPRKPHGASSGESKRLQLSCTVRGKVRDSGLVCNAQRVQ